MPEMRCLLSSEIPDGHVPYPHGPNRVDPDPAIGITFRDELARAISDNYSHAPGRLCLNLQDYQTANDVIALLRRHGIEVP